MVVFFDIDGTLWDYDGKMVSSTKIAIAKLKENGHIPVICTGRAKGHVRDRELLDLGFAGIVAACGAHIEYGGRMIYESFLSDETVRYVIELSEKYNVPIVLEGKQKHWVSGKGFEHDYFVDHMMEVMGDDAVIMNGYTPDMKVNKFAGDILAASEYDSFKRELADDIVVIDHEFTEGQGISQAKYAGDPNKVVGVFEGISKGTGKAMGMGILCGFLGVDIQETYAIGDSNNDIEMVNAAGIGIAMGNGSKALKEIADYVTDDINDDGLYKALEHFGLITKNN